MDCFRCGTAVPRGGRACPACGQPFTTAARGDGKGRAATSALARRFRLRRVLGEGPIGSVYAARDEERGVDVAVKMIRPEVAGSESDRDGFVVAMGRVNAVEHPNVAPVLECGIDGERCYFVMPLLVGLPLRKFLNARRGRRERFLLEEMVPILAQVVDALGAGRPLGPHGNLKAENLILLPDRLVVTDFGLAHAFPAAAFARAQAVSPLAASYRAPELGKGGRPTPQTDVFALAVLATELLAGRPVSESPADAADSVVPQEASAVLGRALEEDPRLRISTPEDFLAELAAAEAGAARVDSTTVRRRLSETTQKITMDQILEVAGEDTDENAMPSADQTEPDLPQPAPPPREITQQISMDMIVPDPPRAPAKSAAPPRPAAPPVIVAPVVLAAPGAALPEPQIMAGPVAGTARPAPSPISPPGAIRAESTDRWVAQPQVVLFDDSADTVLRPKEATQQVRMPPSPSATAVSRPGASGGWLLFLGAAIAGLLLGAGFYWSERQNAERQLPVTVQPTPWTAKP